MLNCQMALNGRAPQWPRLLIFVRQFSALDDVLCVLQTRLKSVEDTLTMSVQKNIVASYGSDKLLGKPFF